MLLTSFFKKILFVYFQREGKRGSNINVQLPLAHPQPGTWPTTRACALTGSWTSNPLVSKLALNPLSHTNQGTCNIPMHRVTSATARENQIFIKLLWETKIPNSARKKEFFSSPTFFLNNALWRKTVFSGNSVVSLCMGSSCPQIRHKNQRDRERHCWSSRSPGPSRGHWDQNHQDGACKSTYSAGTQGSLVTGRPWLHPDELSWEDLGKVYPWSKSWKIGLRKVELDLLSLLKNRKHEEIVICKRTREFYKCKKKYLLSQERFRLNKRKKLLLKSAADAFVRPHRGEK